MSAVPVVGALADKVFPRTTWMSLPGQRWKAGGGGAQNDRPGVQVRELNFSGIPVLQKSGAKKTVKKHYRKNITKSFIFQNDVQWIRQLLTFGQVDFLTRSRKKTMQITGPATQKGGPPFLVCFPGILLAQMCTSPGKLLPIGGPVPRTLTGCRLTIPRGGQLQRVRRGPRT